MNKNQKKLAYYVFVGCLLFFCYKTFNGIMNLGEYSGWRFYALLAGTIIFAGMAITSIIFHPRIKKMYLEDKTE